LALACAVGCALVGPAFVALAGAPPLTASAVWTPTSAIHVHAFLDLGAEGCIVDPPLHEGPIAVVGRLYNRGYLERRLRQAAWRCIDDVDIAATVSATVDEEGSIVDLELNRDLPPWTQVCLWTRIMSDGTVETIGPGTLRASYFMGMPRE
jgi:hypothetical protein